MNTFLDVLKYTLPALVVFLTAYFVLKAYLDHEFRKRNSVLKKEDRQVTLPLRLQAYERLILFLERISPAQLMVRTLNPGQGPYHFQAALLQSIREEFEHNQTQQLYISDQTWLKVKHAKEELIRVINTASTDLREEVSSGDLARHILETWSQEDPNPIQQAIKSLKEEARDLL